MAKKAVTMPEAIETLNGLLHSAFMASGLAWIRDGRWAKPGGPIEPRIPQMQCEPADYGHYIRGFHANYDTAFGVGCTVSISSSLTGQSLESWGRMEVSWGAGGKDHMDAKIIIFELARKTKALYESMAEEYIGNVEVVDEAQEGQA